MRSDKQISQKIGPLENPERFAAIDVGSNAIRMVIAVWTGKKFVPIKKYRFPIRLGAEVFEKGKISPRILKSCARTFEKFGKMTQKFKVKRIRAVGTSALREAKNQAAFVELIRRKSGIVVEVVSGIKEAALIYRAVTQEVGLKGHRALLIDIGGGSVELTFVENGRPKSTHSFPFGTVRTLETLKKRGLNEGQLGIVIGEYIKPLSDYIHKNQMGGSVDFAVGTGGNFETIGKLKLPLLGKLSKSEVTDQELDQILVRLKAMELKDRITKLELRPDRADVVLPAGLVLQAVMKQASVSRLLIPGVGLKDGILLSMISRRAKSPSAAATKSTGPSPGKPLKGFQARAR